MDLKRYLLLPAGGSGTRMGGNLPKQFMEIGGKAILHHTIEKFVRAVPGIRIVLVLPQEWQAYWKEYCFSHNLIYPQTIVAGGFTRFHSVKNGLERIPPESVVAIHDAVRPLLSESLIRKLFGMLPEAEAVVPVIPSVDTMKALRLISDDSGNKTLGPIPGSNPDRSVLFAVQTPQIFLSDVIKKAYGQPYDPKFTDDASVAEKTGAEIFYAEGEKYNIKITTPDDVVIAKALLSR